MNPTTHGGGCEDLSLLNAYQAAIDVSTMSSITDLAGRISYVNPKFCEVSKYTEQELLGQSYALLHSLYHSKEFFDKISVVLLGGQPWHGELLYREKTGRLFWVDAVIFPIKCVEGKSTISYLWLLTPINERKEAELRKASYSAALEEIMNITSHKVRKPISNFLGLMEIVNFEDPERLKTEDVKQVLRYLKESAEELDNFTRELTDYISEMKEKNAENQLALFE